MKNTGRSLMRWAACMIGCILGVLVIPGFDWIDMVLLAMCLTAGIMGYIVYRIDKRSKR